MRRYLAEFLSDPRVVELPSLVWQPILRGIVLTTRPRRSARAYKKVWMEEGSPLAVFTARQAQALDGAFGGQVIVDHAMRYGRPPSPSGSTRSRRRAAARSCWAALPPICAATTATALDAAFAHRPPARSPALRTLPPYYQDPIYIVALKNRIQASLATSWISSRTRWLPASTPCPSAAAISATPITRTA